MARQLMARSRSPRLVNTSDSPPSGVLAEREPTRFAVDRLDDAAGEIEVAADERLDVSRLDAMLPVLGEGSAVPIELMVRARESQRAGVNRWSGGRPILPPGREGQPALYGGPR